MKILQNTSLAITLHVTKARLKENIGKSLHHVFGDVVVYTNM